MGSDDGNIAIPSYLVDMIDVATFEQILEMDDGEDFSKDLVYGFFDQAHQTFRDMEEGIEKRDMYQLYQLGHYLKGSSATLGLIYIKQSCEKIQHWGQLKDATGDEDMEKEECLKRITEELPLLKQEYAAVERALKRFYGDEDGENENE